MKQYHAAILAHDGAALSGLFLPDANLWLNVLTDSAYARAQAKSATAQKIRVSNYRDFAKLVSTTPKSFDPEHSNVVIHTDGTIAAVYFDFVFNVDGKANNRGSETWQLVKAADGWRIASIIYSSEPLCSHRDWWQDPMLDVFQIDDQRAAYCFIRLGHLTKILQPETVSDYLLIRRLSPF